VTWGFSVRPLAADVSSEYDVKAAFILNFARFVEWPEFAFGRALRAARDCVAGDDPFGGTLGTRHRRQNEQTLTRSPSGKRTRV